MHERVLLHNTFGKYDQHLLKGSLKFIGYYVPSLMKTHFAWQYNIRLDG